MVCFITCSCMDPVRGAIYTGRLSLRNFLSCSSWRYAFCAEDCSPCRISFWAPYLRVLMTFFTIRCRLRWQAWRGGTGGRVRSCAAYTRSCGWADRLWPRGRLRCRGAWRCSCPWLRVACFLYRGLNVPAGHRILIQRRRACGTSFYYLQTRARDDALVNACRTNGGGVRLNTALFDLLFLSLPTINTATPYAVGYGDCVLLQANTAFPAACLLAITL